MASEEFEYWKGIGKLVEELGEVQQLLGKALAFPSGAHPDLRGHLRDRLPAEIADLRAALMYFEYANQLPSDTDRVHEKLQKFYPVCWRKCHKPPGSWEFSQ